MALPYGAPPKVVAQLNKQPIDINAQGTVGNPIQWTPSPMTDVPPQNGFPGYVVGYDLRNPPQYINQHIPARPQDGESDPHPFSSMSEANLHPGLFMNEPFPNNLKDFEVPLLVNQTTGVVERGRHGNPLRFFSFLPRWIKADVSGALLELWLRLDTRLSLRQDISERMNPPPVGNIPQDKTLTMRRVRFRERIGAPCFFSTRVQPTRAEVELLGTMTPHQILLNTSMVVDVTNWRFLKPILSEGVIIGYVDSGIPLDYFLSGFNAPIPIPSSRQSVSLALRTRLQTLALAQGLGNLLNNYERLAPEDVPSWWLGRQNRPVARRITEIDDQTHDEFVADLISQ